MQGYLLWFVPGFFQYLLRIHRHQLRWFHLTVLIHKFFYDLPANPLAKIARGIFLVEALCKGTFPEICLDNSWIQ